MFQGSAIDELDRLIAKAAEAREVVTGLLAGMTPDDHGVVTMTPDRAADRASVYRDQIEEFERSGLAVASFLDDLYPDTSGSYRELADLTQRIRDLLDQRVAGHSDETLGGAVVTESADEESGELATG